MMEVMTEGIAATTILSWQANFGIEVDECISCGDPENFPKGECPKSQRACGHHCNHIDSHDNCHWCGFKEPIS
jgi:hypothetical protein